jgi:hypothetical protein
MMQEHQVIDHSIWKELTESIKGVNYKNATQIFENISITYNIEIKNIIKDYLNYIIRNKPEYINPQFLKFSEFIMHLEESNIDYIKIYTVISLHEIFNL